MRDKGSGQSVGASPSSFILHPSSLIPPARLTRAQWLVLAAAFLGWMFDGMEQGLFPMVARSALKDLLGTAADDAAMGAWTSYIMASFLLGAACGGVVFGWLGDRIGRVRGMALSILVYSGFIGACCFASHPWHLAFLQFFAAMGMGGEWALGVAIVVECWPDRLRPALSGAIGAAANCGFLLVGVLGMTFPVTPGHWRWVVATCAAPAFLALLILAFVPESKRWQESSRRAPADPLREIFSPRLRRLVLLGIALASVALIGTWACATAFLPSWAQQLAGDGDPFAKAKTTAALALGAIVGCLCVPVVAAKAGRRAAYFAMCCCSLAASQFLFRCLHSYGWPFLFTVWLTGCTTASFYGWFPLYLPELFPTRVRATAQGVSYNFGRIFAMFGVLGTGALLKWFGGDYARACAEISLVYVAGMLIIWLGPETKGQPLPE
jgi:MFS transporter, SHS family, sialic acid transporter